MLSYNYSGKVVYFETSGALKLAGCQHAWHIRGETRWVEAHLLDGGTTDLRTAAMWARICLQSR